MRVLRTIQRWGCASILVGCADHDPAVSNTALHEAGTVDGTVVGYATLERSELEFRVVSGQPLVRYRADDYKGVEVYGLGALDNPPSTRDTISVALVRAARGKPWYCARSGDFEYTPTGAAFPPAHIHLTDFVRLSPCNGVAYEISFDMFVADGRPKTAVVSKFPILSGAVVSGVPSPVTWTFSGPAGDFYLTLEGNVADNEPGAMIVFGLDPGASSLKVGLSCTHSSRLDGSRVVVGGVSDIVWCADGVPVDGSLTLQGAD